MRSEWKTYKLAEVCSRLSSGKGISAKNIFDKGIYPVYGGNGIRGYTNISNFNGDCAIIGRQGAYCGNVRYFNGEAYMTEHAVIVCANKENCTRYLSYLLSIMNLGRLSGQSAQPGLSVKTIGNQEIILPPLTEQEKISSILSLLDDKIELNNRINENLEQQARAIYSEFILQNQTSSITVGDIVLSANTGADAIQKAPIVDYDTGIRCIRVGDISNQRHIHEWGFTKVTPEIFNQYQLHKNDIVITRTANLGLNRFIARDLQAVYNNGLIRITINSNIIHPIIVYRQFQTEDYRNYINRITGETSVRPNMKINYLLKYSFEILDKLKQLELVRIIKPLCEMQENNIYENITLAQIRDSLLPKLISGELDISGLDL